MIEKLQERSPLKYPIVRCAAALDPEKMADCPEEAAKLFEGLVQLLFEHGRLTSNEAEDAKSQFDSFLTAVVRPNEDVFRAFDETQTRLDEFLCIYLVGNNKYELLFKIVKFVCVLSHGQASIERGFNVNKEVLVVGLEKEGLVSQRLIYDQIRSMETKFHEIPITRKMILSCKGAHRRYTTSLEAKKKVGEEDEKSKKRKMKEEEVMSVKRRKLEVEKVILTLKKDIEQSSIEALAKEDFESMKLCLQKGDSYRSNLMEKEKTNEELEKAITKLEKELKSC